MTTTKNNEPDDPNVHYDAFTCPAAEYTIYHNTVLFFKCKQCSVKIQSTPGGISYGSRFRLPECRTCKLRNRLEKYTVDAEQEEIK